MNLTSTPEFVEWPETHYVFIEKTGPFQTNAPQAWKELHEMLPEILKRYQIAGFFSLYKVEGQIYRAGVGVLAAPSDLPAGLAYEKFPGGRYGRFTLTGSYANLPEASRQVWGIVSQMKLPLRDGYNIENYVNNPRDTPEDQLITEILFPVR